MGRLGFGPRSPDAAGIGPAADRAPVRRGRGAVGVRDRAIRGAFAAGAQGRHMALGGRSPGFVRRRIAMLLLAAALLVVALTLAACGEKPENLKGQTQSFSLTLDFYPNPDHVGI